MRQLTGLLAGWILIAACSMSSAGNSVSATGGRNGLEELEHAWIKALIRSERAAIKRLRSEDFESEFTGDRSTKLAPWLLGMETLPGHGVWVETNLIVDDVQVRDEGSTSIVMSTQTYHAPPRRLFWLEGRPAQPQPSYQVEDHWQERDGRWQVVRRVVRPI